MVVRRPAPPAPPPRPFSVALPAYDRRVWRKWVIGTAVAAPGGALVGLLFGDPANGEFDTALAWGSTSDILMAVGVGVWIVVLPWTAIYFERVNARYRAREITPGDNPKTPGFALGIIALVLGIVGTGPVALAIAVVAWLRIRQSGIRYARGEAAAATAAFAGAVGCVVWTASGPTLF